MVKGNRKNAMEFLRGTGVGVAQKHASRVIEAHQRGDPPFLFGIFFAYEVN
jgi:hypothetical protein